MAFKKCQINFFNNILMAMSAPCQQAVHSVSSKIESIFLF